MDKLVDPYDPTLGNPNQIYSETVLSGLPEFNRSYEISQKSGDTDINVAVGFDDMDQAIQYQFENVFKLSVIQNNQRRVVPIIYGTPERWKSIQADGYYRDKENKIQAPIVIYKRNNTLPVRDLGNKLDGNTVKNFILAKRGYNKRNVYGNFCALNNRVPEKDYIVAFPPDYVEVTYTCLVYTYFVEHMNSLIEAINFGSYSYWGDSSKYMFRARIENFDTSVSVEVGEDRLVKNEFLIKLNGYIIPESLNREVAAVNRVYAPSQIALGVDLKEKVTTCKNCNRK